MSDWELDYASILAVDDAYVVDDDDDDDCVGEQDNVLTYQRRAILCWRNRHSRRGRTLTLSGCTPRFLFNSIIWVLYTPPEGSLMVLLVTERHDCIRRRRNWEGGVVISQTIGRCLRIRWHSPHNVVESSRSAKKHTGGKRSLLFEMKRYYYKYMEPPFVPKTRTVCTTRSRAPGVL